MAQNAFIRVAPGGTAGRARGTTNNAEFCPRLPERPEVSGYGVTIGDHRGGQAGEGGQGDGGDGDADDGHGLQGGVDEKAQSLFHDGGGDPGAQGGGGDAGAGAEKADHGGLGDDQAEDPGAAGAQDAQDGDL